MRFPTLFKRNISITKPRSETVVAESIQKQVNIRETFVAESLRKQVNINKTLLTLGDIKQFLDPKPLAMNLPPVLKHSKSAPHSGLNYFMSSKSPQDEVFINLISQITQHIHPAILPEPPSLKRSLYIFFELYKLDENKNNFKIQLTETNFLIHDEDKKIYSIIFTIDGEEVFKKNIEKDTKNQCDCLVKTLTQPENGNLLRDNISIDDITTCFKNSIFLNDADNSPHLLTFFDTKERLKTYGIQKLSKKEDIATGIRENYMYFGDNLKLKESRDYKDWTTETQAKKFDALKLQLTPSEFSNYIDPYNPVRLTQKIPAESTEENSNLTYAEHYLGKLEELFTILAPYYTKDVDIRTQPIITKDCKLNPLMGQAIKEYIKDSIETSMGLKLNQDNNEFI